jgi:hypothetical protein
MIGPHSGPFDGRQRVVSGNTDLCRFRKFCGLFSGNPADSGSVLIVAS